MNFQNIETKQDSAAKLAQAAGKPTANYLFAPEFNEINERTIQVLVDRMAQTATFHWGESGIEDSYVSNKRMGENYFNNVNLLILRLQNESIINNSDRVTLVLERYKKKRRKGVFENDTAKPSGFRVPNWSENPQSQNFDERKSRFLITAKETVLDLNPEHYFVIDNQNLTKRIYSVKGVKLIRDLRVAGCYIRFRFLVKMAGKEFLSVPTSTIRIMAFRNSNGNTNSLDLSYQLR